MTTSADPVQADLDLVTEGFRSAAVDLITLQMSAAGVFEGTRTKFWTAAGDLWTGEALNPVLGGVSGDPISLQAAMCISWRVHKIWKGGKPRSYLPASGESQSSDGRTFSSALVGAATTHAKAYITAVNAITHGTLTVDYFSALRRFADGGSTSSPKVYLDPPQHVKIVGAAARSVIATQRRRLHRMA